MKGEMSILGREGDLKVTWDSEKQVEVDAARRQFEELMKKNYIAFSVKKDGEKNKKISEFNPELEKMILVPMIQGG